MIKQDKRVGAKYSTTNWTEYNAAQKTQGSLTMLLNQGMQWLVKLIGKCGRKSVFSDAAIQFCLSIRSLFGQPL